MLWRESKLSVPNNYLKGVGMYYTLLFLIPENLHQNTSILLTILLMARMLPVYQWRVF